MAEPTAQDIFDLYEEDAEYEQRIIGVFRGRKYLYTVSLTDDYDGYTLSGSGPTNPVEVKDTYAGWRTILDCALDAFSDGTPDGLIVSLYGIGCEYRIFSENNEFVVMPFASGPWPAIDEFRKKNTKHFPTFMGAMEYTRETTWKEIENERI